LDDQNITEIKIAKYVGCSSNTPFDVFLRITWDIGKCMDQLLCK